MLGICRGMQMMSVAQGLPLYLDIATELGIPNRQYKLDQIDITESPSLMSSLYGDNKFRAVELHHQGIRVDYYEANKQSYPQVSVSSYSNNGMIAESIEYKGFTLDQDYRIDILVEDEFILELKSVEALLPIHKAQLITYLKLANKRLGFLINFNVPLLKNGFQRVIQGY
jgi:GxxExxY protein